MNIIEGEFRPWPLPALVSEETIAGVGMDGSPSLLFVMGEKGYRVYTGYLKKTRLNIFIIQTVQRRGGKNGMRSDWYFQTSQGNNFERILEYGMEMSLPVLQAVLVRDNLVPAGHLEELITQVLKQQA